MKLPPPETTHFLHWQADRRVRRKIIGSVKSVALFHICEEESLCVQLFYSITDRISRSINTKIHLMS